MFIPVVVAMLLLTPSCVVVPPFGFSVAVQTYAVGVAGHERAATIPVVAVPPTIDIAPRKFVQLAVRHVTEVTFVPGVSVAVKIATPGTVSPLFVTPLKCCGFV